MKIDKEKLIQLKREGKTDTECAKVFGCSTEAVRQMCKKLEAEGRLTPGDSVKAEEYIAEKQLQEFLEARTPDPTPTVEAYLAEEEAAEAAKRAEDRDVLTTDDEICYEPVEPVPLPTPDSAVNPKEAPYPIPPIDRKTFWDMRRDELRGAICEYACYGLAIDPEWVEEYNELIGRCGG